MKTDVEVTFEGEAIQMNNPSTERRVLESQSQNKINVNNRYNMGEFSERDFRSQLDMKSRHMNRPMRRKNDSPMNEVFNQSEERIAGTYF